MTSSLPKSRVELHVHLDGSLRPETIWELSKTKGLPLPGDGSLEALKKALVVTEPKDLHHFLKGFQYIMPCVVGDLAAIERIAYEFCEDKAAHGVLYVEARYNPHILLSTEDARGRIHDLSEVVRAVSRGFSTGEAEFGLTVRSILCGLSGTDTIDDVLRLCEIHRDDGVVALDSAAMSNQDPTLYVEVPLTGPEPRVYAEARKLGIHRTVHAGEAGGAEMVRRAVEEFHSERVGHGYRVLEDTNVYESCRAADVHFECCPWSSLLTGAVSQTVAKHPVVRFAEDNINFSISTDDPTISGRELSDDYALVKTWGLTEAHLARMNMNAARSCFLPEHEKAQLVQKLKKVYGFEDA